MAGNSKCDNKYLFADFFVHFLADFFKSTLCQFLRLISAGGGFLVLSLWRSFHNYHVIKKGGAGFCVSVCEVGGHVCTWWDLGVQ